MEETKRCPYCGEEILAIAKKCKHCGEWLEEKAEQKKEKTMIDCPICGEAVEEGTEVCPYWNERIGGAASQPVAAAALTTEKQKKPWLKLTPLRLVAIAVVCGLVSIGIHSINSDSEVAEEASTGTSYVAHAKAVKERAIAINELSHLILEDYYFNWRMAINSRKGYNKHSQKVKCKDFDEAVNWRISYYMTEGVITKMSNWVDEIATHLRAMSGAPAEYASLEGKFTDIYAKAGEAVRLCESPNGNVGEFGSHTQQLYSELGTLVSATDVLIDNCESEGRSLFQSALTSDIRSYFTSRDK